MRVTIISALKGASVASALVLATAGQAWAVPIHAQWSGSGWDTHIDNLDDEYPINISTAEATGSFGISRVEISAEFLAEDPNDPDDTDGIVCDEGYDLLLGFVYSAQVLTFNNHDQLFGASDTGWICINETTGKYYGMGYGAYVDGTGRFSGSNGTWETTFEGMNLEMPEEVTGLKPVGFRSITGKLTGNVNMHGSGTD